MQIRLLGPVELLDDGGRVMPVSAAKRRAFLAELAFNLNSVVPVNRLIDVLWEDDPPAHARTALHIHVSSLRKLLTSDFVLETCSGGYILVGDRSLVDVFVFDDMVTGAEGADDVTAARALRSALRLWRGSALADIRAGKLRDAIAAKLELARLAALEACASRLAKLGRAAELVPDLVDAAEHNPVRESLIRHLMLALYSSGRQAEALGIYDRTRRQLSEDLGVDPSPQLQQAYATVLGKQPSAGTDQPSTRTRTVSSTETHRHGRPSELLRAVPRFTGRTKQLSWMDEITAQSATTQPVLLVVGPAGVGKTAFVTQWAHSAAGRFPDGQLFVNLHGFDESDPCSAETGLHSILRSLGIPTGGMPKDMASQASLYRQTVAGRRMLVVLDNARDAAQVRPLLPGSSGSVAVVTSRHRLDSLVVHEGAVILPMDVLSAQEATALLAKTMGADMVRSDPSSASRLAELCEYLPLALRIVAAQLTNRPKCELAKLVAELADEHQRLAGLATVDAEISVEASLTSSYRALPSRAARLFALLADFPGNQIDGLAAAALTDCSLAESKRALASLAAVHLVERTSTSHYGAHDLVRLYTRKVANRELTNEDRKAAVGRLLYYYVHATAVARRAVTKTARDFSQPADEWSSLVMPEFGSSHAAVSWFLDEEPVIRALVKSARRVGHHPAAWLLTANAGSLYMWQDSATHFVATASSAVEAAEEAADPVGLLLAYRSLAVAYTDAHRLSDARSTFAKARHIASTLPDPNMLEARIARIGLLRALAFSDRDDIVLDDDLVVNSEVPEGVDPFLAVMRLWFLALARLTIGQMDGTLDLVDEAIAVADRNAINSVVHQLHYARGRVLGSLGHFDAATDALRAAISAAVSRGDNRTRAHCLEALGDMYQKVDEAEKAKPYWRSAADLYEQLGSPLSHRLRERLGQSADPVAGPPAGTRHA